MSSKEKAYSDEIPYTQLEVVELAEGHFMLRTADSQQLPLITIDFSKDLANYLGDEMAEVGRAMVFSGIERVGEINAQRDAQPGPSNPVLH